MQLIVGIGWLEEWFRLHAVDRRYRLARGVVQVACS